MPKTKSTLSRTTAKWIGQLPEDTAGSAAPWRRRSTKSMALGVLGLLTAGLSACSNNDRPAALEEYTGQSWKSKNSVMSTLSSDAAYRSAYILLNSGIERGDDAGSGARYAGQFCPEPPPDAAQSVSSAITAALDADVEVPGSLLGPANVAGNAKGGLGVNYGQALATAVAPLIQRSQGLQFYRDQAFYTCVAYLNGVIDADTYASKLLDNAQLAAQVMFVEIVKGDGPQQAGDLQQVEADLAKALEALKPLQSTLGELAAWRKS